MNNRSLVAAFVLFACVALSATAEVKLSSQPAAAARWSQARLNMRPIRIEPEPLGKLHPKLQWMGERKVRGIWIEGNLHKKFEGTSKTNAQIIVDAGFNLVRISGGVDPGNLSTSSFLTNRLPDELKEARRVGIPLLVGWQYGTSHQEPYRKYRSPEGVPAKRSCCPLDEDYIHRHIGRWAVKIARAGADGMLIDFEMYGSDKANYPGPCVCDDCFITYLKEYAGDFKSLYDRVPPEDRGKFLAGLKAEEHYGMFMARSIADQYDKIRRECQEINRAFFFAEAPALFHLPGIEHGLGTSTVPCLVFSEHEYHYGPYKNSYKSMDWIRDGGYPAIFLCGAYLLKQPPKMLSESALLSSLYCDGWWAWYGTALLVGTAANDPKGLPEPYGRLAGTSASDYLDEITAMHRRLDELLRMPRHRWPKMVDMKARWEKTEKAKADKDK